MLLLITFQWHSICCHCRPVEDVLTIYQFSWHNCWIQSSWSSCYCHSFCLQQDDFNFEMLQMWSLETWSWREGVRECYLSSPMRVHHEVRDHHHLHHVQLLWLPAGLQNRNMKRGIQLMCKKDNPLLANLQKKCTVITEICTYPVIDSTVNVISLCAATGLVQVFPSSCKLNITWQHEMNVMFFSLLLAIKCRRPLLLLQQ